jgi:hypothetical protein
MVGIKDGLSSSLQGLLFALFAMVFGTITHQTQLAQGLPIGLFFSLSMVLMLAAAIRDRQRGKLPGFVFTLTLGLGLFVISRNFGGDILIPGNNAGLWWSYGAVGVAALVAMWPKLKRQRTF